MSDPIQLDAIDRRILELLQADGRRTVSDISDHVNLSPAPVKRRIDRLESLGVIAGYTVVLDHAKLGSGIEAFTEVSINTDGEIDEIVASISKMPEVREIFTIAGDPDALVRIRVDDVEHLKGVVNELRRGRNVTGTKSLIVLDRWVRSDEARRQATSG